MAKGGRRKIRCGAGRAGALNGIRLVTETCNCLKFCINRGLRLEVKRDQEQMNLLYTLVREGDHTKRLDTAWTVSAFAYR